MIVLILLVFVVGIQAETAADLAKRSTNLGQKFITETEVKKVSTCLEKPLYEQKDIPALKQDAMKCAVTQVNPMKYATGLSLLSQLDRCLSPDKWTDLVDKIYTTAYPIFGPLLEKVNNSLTKWKKNNKKQAQCISDGYKMILNQVATKAILDDMCKKIVKKAVTKKQWACALQFAPKVLDVNKYSCAKIVPPK